MKKQFLAVLILGTTIPMIQADYIARVPLEQARGGSLPDGSVLIGSGSGGGGGGGSAPTVTCNYAGQRNDGLPNYNGYGYHHVEYRSANDTSTIWYNNNYIGSGYSTATLTDMGYSRGTLMHVGEFGNDYYELCVHSGGTN